MVNCLSKSYTIKDSDALLVTDIQIDFLPGGALPIADGDEIIPVINAYIRRFNDDGAHVLASRDWHPASHTSFKAQGGPWPPHCIQDTEGAKFSPKLKLPGNTLVISKATDPNREAYSAFDGTNLANELQKLGVNRLFVCGLATDYCVLNTVIDARKFGYETIVLLDATLGINVQPGDVDRAIKTMLESGAQQSTTADFPDAEDSLPLDAAEPDMLEEKPSFMAAVKKKARMRPRGSAKRIRTERKG
jgi:nicotinamidase/pyrazinamidase